MKIYRTMTRHLKDATNIIYIVTLLIVVTLIQIAFSINVDITNVVEKGLQSSNSAPMMIVFIGGILNAFFTRYWLQRNGKELANYLLVGLRKKDIFQLFWFTNSILCFISLFLGILMGGVVLHFLSAYVGFVSSVSMLSIILTIGSYLIIYVFGIVMIYFKILNLQLIQLMNFHNKYEKFPTKKEIQQNRLLLMGSLFILIIQLMNLNHFIFVGTIALNIIFFSYQLFKNVINEMQVLRMKKFSVLFKKNRMIVLCNILSRSQQNVIVYTITMLCFLVSFVTYLVGSIFLNSKSAIIDKEIDFYMGNTQLFLAILFLVIVFVVFYIKISFDLVDIEKQKKLIHSLGGNKFSVRGMVKYQVLINFFVPILGFLFVFLLVAWPVYIFGANYLNPMVMLMIPWYFLLFFVLSSLYFVLSYFTSLKRINTY